MGVQGLMKSCVLLNIIIYLVRLHFHHHLWMHMVSNKSLNHVTPLSNNSTQINHSYQKPSNKMPIISAIVSSVLVVLFICLLTTWRRWKVGYTLEL
jgi:hypothetical protein